MITDDERRETVGNLRHLSHMDRVRCKEESYGLPDETVTEPGIGYRERNDAFERIAGPIGRGECENVHDGNEMGACGDGFERPACGCGAGDEERRRVSGTWNFRPSAEGRRWAMPIERPDRGGQTDFHAGHIPDGRAFVCEKGGPPMREAECRRAHRGPVTVSIEKCEPKEVDHD